jgi:signal transduction histidine kinase/DNA-binding response OmpR family regulator/HPt (histidine-containing phosphotransfer) domain-containing protein
MRGFLPIHPAPAGQPAPKTSARRRLAVLLAALLLVLGAGDSRAQTGDHVVLDDAGGMFDAGPHAYITADPGGQMDYNAFVTQFNAGRRGAPADGTVINLGAQGVPHWIVLSVENRSWTEGWMLSFGQRMEGRMGLLRDIQVYDGVHNVKYLDTISAAQNPYVSEGSAAGVAVRVNIPRSQKAVFIIHAVPMAGHTVTLVPRFISDKGYIVAMKNPYQVERFLFRFFMLAIGFFAGAWVFGHMRGGWLFVVYYALQYAMYMHNNAVLYSASAYTGEMQEVLFSAVFVAGLFMSRYFLEVTATDQAQDRMIVGFAVALLLALAGSVVVLPATSPVRQVGLLLPVLGVMVYMTLLSAAQVYTGKYGAVQFAAGWGALLAGMLISNCALLNILPPLPVFVSAYWYAVMIQGALFMTAATTKILAVESEFLMAQAEKDENAEKLAALRQSKEAAENSRLRRLIEHERDVMNRLREREVQQNDEMRKAKDAADEANRAKSAFLAVISHEIRTPMSGIMGMVRLLLDSRLSKDQYDYAQTIQDSGDAMLALLNDILDFEKIESGKLDLEHIDFDLHRLVNGVITLMNGHAQAKNIYLKANMDPSLPRYVIGDPVRLRQVLLNLVGNSIKFTKTGGVTLHVKIDPTADARAATVHRVRFAVEDTGIGISREAQKNLFNPFSQADASVSRKFGGTGLGLAISQRLIEAMGGRIHIDSTEGKGSTFFFTLIVEGGTAAGVEHQGAGLTQGAPEKALKILVVEDNEINQKLMKEFLQRFGHQIVLAGTGEEALDALELEPFDLILMDIELPGLSGMGVTKAIRAMPDRARAATPVIALTGKTRDEDIGMAYAANMNGHLSKPVDPKRLRQAIDKVMSGALDNPVELPDQPSAAVRPRRPAPSAPEAPAQAAQNGFTHRTLSLEDDDSVSLLAQQYGAPRNGQDKTMVMGENGRPVFDDSMLAPLKGAMARDELQGMIDGLFDKMDEIIGDLKGRAAGDAEALAGRAHDLKGMSGNFGLMELSQVAAELEASARDADADAAQALLARVPEAGQRARAALQGWLDR